MAGLDVGQTLAAITTVSTVVIAIWTRLGTSKDTAFTRVLGERDRLDKRVAELEKGREEDRKARDEDRARLDHVERELEALRLDHKTLLDFLRDIVSGHFDHDWIKSRAGDLLGRFGGGGGTP